MLQPLHELYYFKKPENLKNIEKYIEDIRKLGTDKKKNKTKRVNLLAKIITSLYKQFNFDPEFSNIELKFTKKFVCEIAYGFLNGIPEKVDDLIDMDKKQRKFKFKPAYAPTVTIRLSTSVLFNKLMTPAMIVAALLHEIGHSFEWRLRILYYEVENVESALDFLDKINFINLGKDKLETLAHAYNSVFSPRLSHPFTGSGATDWQEAESFCDQFAVLHGYGEELTAFLSWCEKEDIKWFNKKYDKKDDVTVLYKLIYDISFYLSHIFDTRTHPEYGERIRLITVALKAELKNNKSLSPREKKILQTKINNIDKQVNEVLKHRVGDSYEVEKTKSRDIEEYNKGMSPEDLKTRGIDYMLNKHSKTKTL